MHKPNPLVLPDVKESLYSDALLDDERIVVKADDGRITLSGVVRTFDQIERAAFDAWAIQGVKAVDNQLLAGPSGAAVTDRDIAAASALALDADRIIPKGSVTAEVEDGHVTLLGKVRNPFQRQAAKHAVGQVDGVLGITDLITLTHEPIPSDVAARIQKALERNAIIDDSSIKVSRDGHTIYLDGTTNSYVSVVTAGGTAWNAPGVDQVVNRLTIIP